MASRASILPSNVRDPTKSISTRATLGSDMAEGTKEVPEEDVSQDDKQPETGTEAADDVVEWPETQQDEPSKTLRDQGTRAQPYR